MRKLVVLAAVTSMTVALLASDPAAAQKEPPIQPGAAVQLSAGPPGGCTLSFVFRDRRHTYIGTVARCGDDGDRASMAGREFGTVVFFASTLFSEPVTPIVQSGTGSIDDLALIQVDASELHRVSPVVLDVGRAPGGVTTTDRTKEGDEMSMTGQGIAYRDGPARHRRGVLISDDQRAFHLAIPATVGDGGSPVLDANFNAYGMLSSGGSPKGPYGMTIEYILHLLRKGGFHVELVTA